MYIYFLNVQFSYVHFRPVLPCRFHSFRKTVIYKVNTKQSVKATKHVACLCGCSASVQRETFTDLRNLFKRNITLAKSVYYRTEIELARAMFRFTSYLIGCCRCSVLPKCNDDPDSVWTLCTMSMSRNASSSIPPDREMAKSVASSRQPCLTTFVTLKDSETSHTTLTFAIIQGPDS